MSESLDDCSVSRAVYSCWLCRADHRKALALAVAAEPWVVLSCKFLEELCEKSFRAWAQTSSTSYFAGPELQELIFAIGTCALLAAGVFSASSLLSCSS